MLGISPASSSVSTFHVGTNLISYPHNVSQTIEYSFNEPNDISNDTTSDTRRNTPELFTYNQSVYQAFYFIQTADIVSIAESFRSN